MKPRIIQITLLAVMAAAICGCDGPLPDDFLSSNYYLSAGEKIVLTGETGRCTVFFERADTQKVIMSLCEAGITVSESDVDTYCAWFLSEETLKTEKMEWKIITLQEYDEEVFETIPEITYWGPYYKVWNGSCIGITNVFAVELKNGGSITPLKDFAKACKVLPLGIDPHTQGWYIFVCTRESKGNSLEMANHFYKTGLLDESAPDMWSDVGHD